MMPERKWQLVVIAVVAIIVTSCSQEVSPGKRQANDLELRYQYDAFGLVESVTASKGRSIVASAKRIRISPVGGPTVTDIEVEETHFSPGTQNVSYKGKLVFRCKTNQEFGERISDTPIEGTRSQDLFQRWPYATTGLQ